MTKKLTLEACKAYLDEHDGGLLYSGQHGDDEPKFCVREIRAVMLDQPKNDHPDGESASITDKICQSLNDEAWSSDEVRTEACLPLVLLTEADAEPGYLVRYCERIIREIVPIALEAVASVAVGNHPAKLREAAKECRERGTADAARAASYAASAAASAASATSDAASYARAASYAASYAASDAASDAASAASYAASAASDAASDDVLSKCVTIFIECHTGSRVAA